MTDRNSEQGYPLGPVRRWLLAFWSIFLIAGFALAISLEPSPRGYGTHRQLGLPPCSFYVWFDIPCPSCGMTTSFSNFVRGQIVASAQANLAGLLLAIFCLVQIPWCWMSVYRGRLWKVDKPDSTLMWFLIVLAVICLAQWVIRII